MKYRSFRHLDSKKVSEDLLLHTSNINDYHDFENCLLSILDTHAPLKSKKLRANTKPFINKSLCKEIAVRSRLKNIANTLLFFIEDNKIEDNRTDFRLKNRGQHF